MKTKSYYFAAALLVVTACTADKSADADIATVEPPPPAAVDANTPASVPTTMVPDSFTNVNGNVVYDGRKAYDLTGDGKPETVVLHMEGKRTDSADVRLAILGTAADTLFQTGWNTRLYFIYEYRNTFTDDSANAKILKHLKRVLSDASFSAGGPSRQMKKSMPDSAGGIDRDAIRYDLKEEAVRKRHNLSPSQPLQSAMYAELEKVSVPDSTIDSIAKELRKSSTFTYFAGGEATYTIAWSEARKRFYRIFACC